MEWNIYYVYLIIYLPIYNSVFCVYLKWVRDNLLHPVRLRRRVIGLGLGLGLGLVVTATLTTTETAVTGQRRHLNLSVNVQPF